MIQSDAALLVQYVKSLPDFERHEEIDGHYDHIGAIIAEAVLQANRDYAKQVKPRVERILNQYQDVKTTTLLIELLKNITTNEFLNLGGYERVNRFNAVLGLFSSENIDTEAELRCWLTHDSNLEKLLSIKGIGPETVDYFKILVGFSTSAANRHLNNFLMMAGLTPRNYSEAQAVINEAADILCMDRAKFDHSIWHYMRSKE